jgi:hypothetical protein
VAFFGTDVFSFLRYYALSSTPLAYVAYLRAARALLDVADTPRRSGPALCLAGCLLLMAFNHLQELLLTAVFATAVVLWRALERVQRARRAWIPALGLAAGLLLALGGRLAVAHAQALGLHGIDVPRLWPWLSRFGILRVWDPALNFWPAIGIAGLVGIGLAILRPQAHRLLALATLLPPALLLFPPFALAFVLHSHPGNAYRILYAIPPTFMAVAVTRQLWEGRAWRRHPAWAGAALIALGSIRAPPLWGKLPFQLYRPPDELALVPLDEMAQWFHDNRRLPNDCLVKSDAITETAAAGFLGRRITVERVSGAHLIFGRWGAWAFSGPREMAAYRDFVGICGFLAVDADRVTPAACPDSWVGASSGHWPARAACLPARLPPTLATDSEALLALGWTRTAVPPFYWYYEPPP